MATILLVVMGLDVLAGVIWLVMAFYQWFRSGMLLWLITSIRKLFS